jgi:hypothetical protein
MPVILRHAPLDGDARAEDKRMRGFNTVFSAGSLLRRLIDRSRAFMVAAIASGHGLRNALPQDQGLAFWNCARERIGNRLYIPLTRFSRLPACAVVE